MLTLDYV